MSSAPKKQPRADKDHYVTPRRVVDALVDELVREPWLPPRPLRVLDPGAGTGVLARSVRDGLRLEYDETYSPPTHIVAVEADPAYEQTLLDDGAADEVVIADYLKYEIGVPRIATAVAGEPVQQPYRDYPVVEPFDLIVCNPPFSMLQRFISHSLELLAPGGVCAMLLNMHAYGSGDRVEWWKQHAPDAQRVLAPRPSFTGGGTDSTEYAWVLWGPRPVRVAPFGWYHVPRLRGVVEGAK